MQHPYLRIQRSEKQKKKDLAALQKAKKLEAKKVKQGARFKKINANTYVLTSKP